MKDLNGILIKRYKRKNENEEVVKKFLKKGICIKKLIYVK
jgi:hypothetical protein